MRLVALVVTLYVTSTLTLSPNGINVRKVVTYKKTRYTTKCGFFGWGRCTRYRSILNYSYKCAPGYISTDNIDCSHVQACSAVANCDRVVCTTRTDQTCTRCEGVIQEKAGHRAYVISANRTNCTKACSWRKDSTWCYPGTCVEEFASNCVCSDGFAGHNCEIISAKPQILFNVLELRASNGATVQAPPDVNSGPIQTITWSNLSFPSNMYYKFIARFNVIPPPRHAFIENCRVGIIGGSVKFTINRGGAMSSSKTIICGGASKSKPATDIYTCEGHYPASSIFLLPFQHMDQIEFEYKTTNGGFVTIRNKETRGFLTHYYRGTTQTHRFTVTVDLAQP